MNSLTAALAMRSKRPATVLIIQFPRRSSESQPYTAGTSGHFIIERNTIWSIFVARGRRSSLRQAVEQQAIALVALEDFPAAVAGKILVVHPVQFLAQQPHRHPQEQRIAVLDVARDR